ncbi:MAG: ATP-binding protein [Planctomycetota bacterium]|nr:ATP-binding protein [Planctomycetota bacterium]
MTETRLSEQEGKFRPAVPALLSVERVHINLHRRTVLINGGEICLETGKGSFAFLVWIIGWATKHRIASGQVCGLTWKWLRKHGRRCLSELGMGVGAYLIQAWNQGCLDPESWSVSGRLAPSDKAWQDFGGILLKELLCVSKLPPRAVEVLKPHPNEKMMHLKKGVEIRLVPDGPDIDALLQIIQCRGPLAGPPQRPAVRRKEETAAAERGLRRRLREEAESNLKDALRSPSTKAYVELKLSIGRLATREEREAAGDAFSQKPLEMGRIWGACDTSLLKPPRENYFLSSVSGAGKTTFLRHLQFEMLKSGDLLVAYVEAKNLVYEEQITWPCVRRVILKNLDLTAKAVRRALNKAHSGRKVVLIVDALDNLGEIGLNCSKIVTEVISPLVGCPVLMAGRPSAARWVEDRCDVVLLKLEQFDDPACRMFFGESYERAREICQHSWDLVRTPMLAYMVRFLIRIGQDKGITCRWKLYSRFVHHMLFEHPSNRQRTGHDDWANDVLDSLAMVSYYAIDRQEPSLVVIPSAVVREIADDRRLALNLDLLGSAGLADVVDVSRDPHGPDVVFTHQSFQEYLAAEWASRSEERTSHVIDEYWNPKWRDVIKFLAGKDREKIVRRIYPSPESDNPIHSRLFLAAECAGETSISINLENALVTEACHLSADQVFQDQALKALMDMNTPRSHEAAWNTLVLLGCRLHSGISSSSHFRCLFTAARLRWALNVNDPLDRWVAKSALLIWAANGGKVLGKITNALKRSPLGFKPHTAPRLAPASGRWDSHRVFKRLARRPQHLDYLACSEAVLSTFTHSQRAALAKRFFSRPTAWGQRSNADVLAPYLGEECIQEAYAWWLRNPQCHNECPRLQSAIAAAMRPEMLECCVSMLTSSDDNMRKGAISLLIDAGDRLSDPDVRRLVRSVLGDQLGYHGTSLLRRFGRRLTSKEIERVFDIVSRRPTALLEVLVQHQFLYGCVYLGSRIIEKYWRTIRELLDSDSLSVAEVLTCCGLADRLGDDEWNKVLRRTMEQMTFSFVNMAESIAPYLKEGHMAYLREKLQEEKEGMRMAAWMLLLNPALVLAGDITVLVKCLVADKGYWDVENSTIRYAAHKKLQSLHGMGILERLREGEVAR